MAMLGGVLFPFVYVGAKELEFVVVSAWRLPVAVDVWLARPLCMAAYAAVDRNVTVK